MNQAEITQEAPKPKKKLMFEEQTCSRCRGTGKYSFNMTDGDRCYGCGGIGVQLTKRGKAAQAFYRNSLMVPVSSLVPGDVIRTDGITRGGAMFGYSATVIGTDADGGTVSYGSNGVTSEYTAYIVKLNNHKFGDSERHCHPGATIECLSRDIKGKRQTAQDYQATLLKTGKVAKSKKAGGDANG